MKTMILKIRPHFLPLIRKGIKRHEYRLNSPKYTSLKVGDRMVLKSNQDDKDFAIVRINKVTKFENWEKALENFWKEDFQGLYSNYEELKKECIKFYKNDDVRKYGIDVFEIELDKLEFLNSRFLLDTNIIIQRESTNNCSFEINLVYKAIEQFKGKKFFHQITEDELKEYKDDKVKESMITKLNSYFKLSSLVIDDDYFKQVVSIFGNDKNSKNDNEILYQVYSGRVDFLITEDQGILRKAKKLYLKNRVMCANEFLKISKERNPQLINYNALSVTLKKIGSLSIDDSFFDSLREDYGGLKFNQWLNKKAEEKAYIFNDNKGLQGFLYLKKECEDEDYSDLNPILSPMTRLKVGTFKINSTGKRLGERFLKIIFDNALKLNVDEIYVTMFKDKRKEVSNLMHLMMEWGFEEKGTKKNGEIYLIKDMKHYDRSKGPKFNYPLVKEKCSISFLPIDSKYHTKLFPDLHLKNEDALFFDDACSYAIEKIYITAWKDVSLNPGDLLCVYYIADFNKKYRSSVTGTCILNEVNKTSSADELTKICKNRSVFTEEEIKELYDNRMYRTVVKVLYLKPFTHKVNYACLKDLNLLGTSDAPRLNSKLTYEEYEKLNKIGEQEL